MAPYSAINPLSFVRKSFGVVHSSYEPVHSSMTIVCITERLEATTAIYLRFEACFFLALP